MNAKLAGWMQISVKLFYGAMQLLFKHTLSWYNQRSLSQKKLVFFKRLTNLLWNFICSNHLTMSQCNFLTIPHTFWNMMYLNNLRRFFFSNSFFLCLVILYGNCQKYPLVALHKEKKCIKIIIKILKILSFIIDKSFIALNVFPPITYDLFSDEGVSSTLEWYLCISKF